MTLLIIIIAALAIIVFREMCKANTTVSKIRKYRAKLNRELKVENEYNF
jgi:hypothetical protein